jgi:hypothetical protein
MLADQTHVFLRCGVGRSGISWRFVGRGRVNRCLVVGIISSSNGDNSSENDKLKTVVETQIIKLMFKLTCIFVCLPSCWECDVRLSRLETVVELMLQSRAAVGLYMLRNQWFHDRWEALCVIIQSSESEWRRKVHGGWMKENGTIKIVPDFYHLFSI